MAVLIITETIPGALDFMRNTVSRYPDWNVRMLSGRKDDQSEYVRRSVGNALKDISKKFPSIVSPPDLRPDVSEPLFYIWVSPRKIFRTKVLTLHTRKRTWI